MVKKILNCLVSNPWIYNRVQELAGGSRVHHRIATQIALLNDTSLVLDLGGGTGVLHSVCAPNCTYVCLDIDKLKLRSFLKMMPDGIPLLGDATRAPIKSDSVDIVLCEFVFHHVPDELFEQLIRESMRVLKSTGKFIFVDAVWKPTRWVARLLWKYDRGNFPRTSQTLYSTISRHCEIVHWERFAVFHEYFLGVGTRNLFRPN